MAFAQVLKLTKAAPSFAVVLVLYFAQFLVERSYSVITNLVLLILAMSPKSNKF